MVSIPRGQNRILTEFTWSPLGDQVAYSLKDITRSLYFLYLHTVGSDEPDVLLWAGGDTHYTIEALDWSPDGVKIASISRGGNWLMVVDSVTDNPSVTQVRYQGAVLSSYHNLRWSPDCQYFALTAQKYLTPDAYGGIRFDIARVPASGGKIIRFTARLDDGIYRDILSCCP